MSKLQQEWNLRVKNPVVRTGERGGFKWTFRRFWLDIETVSGNFKARFMAAEHPYAYLLAGKDDENIHGYCQTLYTLGMMITTDQTFVDDINDAVRKYKDRLEAEIKVQEDDGEETIALEEVKQVQEYVEMEPKERKKKEKEINKRFKKAAKNA